MDVERVTLISHVSFSSCLADQRGFTSVASTSYLLHIAITTKFLWSVTSMVCVESKRLSRSVRCLLILAAPEGQKAVRGPPPRVVKDLDPPGSLAAFVLEASERSQRHICYSWTQLIAECMRWGNVCTRLAVEEEKPQYDDGDAMKSFFLLQAAIWLSGQISQNNLIEVKSRHQYQIETIS